VLLGKEMEMEMHTITTAGTSHKQPGILYPLMLIAAIALIVFSIIGIATMMGWIPTALSGRHVPEKSTASPRMDATTCTDCGIIESIRASKVETGMKGAMTYQIRVRMSDGATRTFHESAQPALAIGQRVRVTERGIAAAG
jgi:hypothetical protein